MHEETKTVVIKGREQEVTGIKVYDTIEELLSCESADLVLDTFNHRNKQLQVQAKKKALTPVSLTMKEKRFLCYNKFSFLELKKSQKHPELFESYIEKYMPKVLEQMNSVKEV